MRRHAARGSGAIPALAALMILVSGCGGSSHTSAPKTSPTAASSKQATAAACHKIQAELTQSPARFSSLARHPSSVRSKVNAFLAKLKQEAAAGGNPALSSAVGQFSRTFQKVVASAATATPGKVASFIKEVENDAQKIVMACNRAAG